MVINICLRKVIKAGRQQRAKIIPQRQSPKGNSGSIRKLPGTGAKHNKASETFLHILPSCGFPLACQVACIIPGALTVSPPSWLQACNAKIPGADCDTLVDAVVAWTSGGAITGGTGLAIRIAQEHGIRVLNLGVLHPSGVCERLEVIRIAALPAVRDAASARSGGNRAVAPGRKEPPRPPPGGGRGLG